MRTHKTARSGTAVLLSVACLLGLGILAVPASPLLAVQQADPPPDAVPAEIPTAIDQGLVPRFAEISVSDVACSSEDGSGSARTTARRADGVRDWGHSAAQKKGLHVIGGSAGGSEAPRSLSAQDPEVWVCIDIATIEFEDFDVEIILYECYLAGADCMPLYEAWLSCIATHSIVHPYCLSLLAAFIACAIPTT